MPTSREPTWPVPTFVLPTWDGPKLSGADLSAANLKGAYKETNDGSKQLITNEELAHQQIRTLEGATMPNGQKYEEWRKSREARGEDRVKPL